MIMRGKKDEVKKRRERRERREKRRRREYSASFHFYNR